MVPFTTLESLATSNVAFVCGTAVDSDELTATGSVCGKLSVSGKAVDSTAGSLLSTISGVVGSSQTKF